MPSLTRYYMVRNLDTYERTVRTPEPYVIATLEPGDVEALVAAEVASFEGTPDAELFPELANPESTRKVVSAMLAGEEIYDGVLGPYLADLSFKISEADRLCGAIYTLNRDGAAFVLDMFVRPEYQGRGLGKALLAHALARFKDAGFHRSELAVTASNVAAVRLYETLGFEIVEVANRGTED